MQAQDPTALPVTFQNPSDGVKSVIVIGAGAAGLSAASVLRSNGWSVVVLEASSRTGGRIKHLSGFANFHIELGAEEVHGMGNCLENLIGVTGTRLIAHKTANDYIRHEGTLLPMTKASSYPGMKSVLQFMSQLGEYEGPPVSVRQLVESRSVSAGFHHYLESRVGVEHGAPLCKLGVAGLAGAEGTWQMREKNYTLDRSYITLLGPLVNNVSECVRLGARVTRIDWSNSVPFVQLESGETIFANAVVYTGSLALLRDSPPVFNPGLPAEKKRAILNIGMDGGMKVVLRFSRRFWPDRMYFLHSDTAWPQYWCPSPHLIDRSPVLTAFVGDQYTGHLMSRDDIVRFALGDLDKIFGPGTATNHFVSAHIEDWTANPFVRGLYSYPLPSTTPSDRVMLAAPVEEKLFFAGEATDTQGQSATVHGAINSGFRAASEILSAKGPRRQLIQSGVHHIPARHT